MGRQPAPASEAGRAGRPTPTVRPGAFGTGRWRRRISMPANTTGIIDLNAKVAFVPRWIDSSPQIW